MHNLSIYQKNIFEQYKSNSQIARRLTEDWCSDEMYCPSCLNNKLHTHPNNQKVSDFFCVNCNNEFQLKSSNKKFSKKIVDGEYNTMIQFITSDSTPHFVLMHYSKDEWVVKNLILIPKFFISTSIIERRNPLSSTAKRAGWVGCNILLSKISNYGKINIIKNEHIIDKQTVHKKLEKMTFLNKQKPNLRGWTLDVLNCVEDLNKKEFSLKDIYLKKDYLNDLYPDNHHIEAKIRQQLQILRNNGILKFMSKGRYKLNR